MVYTTFSILDLIRILFIALRDFFFFGGGVPLPIIIPVSTRDLVYLRKKYNYYMPFDILVSLSYNYLRFILF